MKKLFLIIVALFALQMQAQTYIEWSTTNALPTEAGTYRLTTDVTLSAAWVVPEGETVLDLNDHIVKLVKESGTDHVISIGKDRTLTIEDKAATKTTRYWEEHETYHYWRNPSTTDNGFGLTTVGGCITGGTGKGESDEQWENLLPDGFPSEKGFSYVGGGNQYDGRAKDNGESFIETEPLPQMKFNMWEEDEEEESDSYFKTK